MREGAGEETELAGAPGTQFHPNQGLGSEHLERRRPAFLRGSSPVEELNEHSFIEKGTQRIQVKLRGPQLTPRTSA